MKSIYGQISLRGSFDNSEKKIRNKITIITFICSVLVVLGHNYNLNTYKITEKSTGIANIAYDYESFWGRINGLAVPFFFLISGLLFFRTFSLDKLIKKWKSRFHSILIPYIVWCSLYYLYFVICTHTEVIKRIMNSEKDVKFSFLTWIDWLWKNQYYTLWFLKHIIVFIVAAPLLYFLLKDYWKRIPTGLVVMIVLTFLLSKSKMGSGILGGLDMYMLGAWIGINHKEWLQYRNKWLSVIGLIYIVFDILTAEKFELKIAVFISTWFVLDFVEREKELPWWMGITFFVYVSHDFVLEVIKKVFWVTGGNKPSFALLSYIVSPVAVYFILIGVSYVLRRFFPHLWMILSGGRSGFICSKTVADKTV